MLADLVDRDNSRMIQLCDCRCFLAKTIDILS